MGNLLSIISLGLSLNVFRFSIRLGLFFSIMGIFISPARGSESQSVRVRLLNPKDHFQILAVGIKDITINEKSLRSEKSINKKNIGLNQIQFHRGSFKWQGARHVLRPGDRVRIEASLLQQGGSWLGSEIEVHSQNKGYQLVKKVSLEDYLLGVLSKEVPLSWPAETLKAQAVASLSYVLARQKEQRKKIFDVETSVLDQHYDSGILQKKSEVAKKSRSLIQEVLGYRLKDEKGQILKAYFHADCGGETVSAHKVWGGSRTPEVLDPYCQSRTSRKWVYEIETDQPLKVLERTNWSASADSKLLNEGRISKLSYEGKVFSLNEFRQFLGFDRVRSGKFEIESLSENRFKLKGIGHGHGVGLCQQGSFVMGQIGKSFKEILNFYYPQSTLFKSTM